MSKRVSNKRRSQQNGAPARSTRIRLGFHRNRKITNVERAMEDHKKKYIMGGPMDREAKELFASLNSALNKLKPKRPEHRGVR